MQAEGTRFHAVAVHLEPLLAIGRRSGQQRPDRAGHLQIAHARDQQRRRRLVAAVRAIAGLRADGRGRQQAQLVVVAQCAEREASEPGKAADRQELGFAH